ncbi:hypothetical protein FQN60_008599 [Etheostoma spectabile]|uniref:Uncharacterized protein n=1 Tax=Etheostoma spectabile TaxID=54343 RepID=A0A5J5CM25_9PERO|nr:hypothetical protein FQN60_008599 [Etheostoma spectabile]
MEYTVTLVVMKLTSVEEQS